MGSNRSSARPRLAGRESRPAGAVSASRMNLERRRIYAPAFGRQRAGELSLAGTRRRSVSLLPAIDAEPLRWDPSVRSALLFKQRISGILATLGNDRKRARASCDGQFPFENSTLRVGL
jgi:hypothetical protein